MGRAEEKARYGYHVPHMILAGFAGAAVLVFGGVLLIATTVSSPWFVAVAVTCFAAGAVLIALTSSLLWLVVLGRPLAMEHMLDAITWTGNERILDVGCGPGLALVGAAKRLTTGRAVGIDKWMVIHGERHNSREIALENARIEGVADRVEVQDGDASAMPFDDGSFDVTMSSFVFHHMTKEVRLRSLREMVRVTKPGGRILIADDRTGELATALQDLDVASVVNLRLIFPVYLVSARKEKRHGTQQAGH
ncbi:MAG: class I SAM-dependent methyltransferase [Deltaproteobacteria bacterium]|nr:class I SAM-dependent methyltransferase [Deltaproteobacteria bacterium]